MILRVDVRYLKHCQCKRFDLESDLSGCFCLFVRTASRKVKLTFILCFGSNKNAFYLYMATGVACSSTPCYAHAWLYKGCGYYENLSVPCIFAQKFWEGGGDLWMIFCLSLSNVWVVSTLIGGGETQTLTSIIEFIWTFFTKRQSGQ